MQLTCRMRTCNLAQKNSVHNDSVEIFKSVLELSLHLLMVASVGQRFSLMWFLLTD